MTVFQHPPYFRDWFEVYRSFGCFVLSLMGVYTLWATHGRNRCIDVNDTTEPILPLVMTGHYIAASFFLIDMFVLTLVKNMWRLDLFIHHCICLFLLGYFTIDFPLMGSIFYIGESLTIMNFLRPSYPIGVTVWRLIVLVFFRFPVFGTMFARIAWQDDNCIHHHKAPQLACAMCFFFIYDIYVLQGCVLALYRQGGQNPDKKQS
jgi:hypothetical protein